MTLEEAEKACAEVQNLARELSEWPNRELADRLARRCKHHRIHMRGQFGNVAEQLGRLYEAAALCGKDRVDWERCRTGLSSAAGRIDLAMAMHRMKMD